LTSNGNPAEGEGRGKKNREGESVSTEKGGPGDVVVLTSREEEEEEEDQRGAQDRENKKGRAYAELRARPRGTMTDWVSGRRTGGREKGVLSLYYFPYRKKGRVTALRFREGAGKEKEGVALPPLLLPSQNAVIKTRNGGKRKGRRSDSPTSRISGGNRKK